MLSSCISSAQGRHQGQGYKRGIHEHLDDIKVTGMVGITEGGSID